MLGSGLQICSSRSSGQRPGKGRGKKHEIYAAAFGGHLFYDLFSQGRGGPWPPAPLRIRYWILLVVSIFNLKFWSLKSVFKLHWCKVFVSLQSLQDKYRYINGFYFLDIVFESDVRLSNKVTYEHILLS